MLVLAAPPDLALPAAKVSAALVAAPAGAESPTSYSDTAANVGTALLENVE